MVNAGTNERGKQYLVVRFGNGFGVSVIRGPYSYGGPEGFFELAVLRFPDESNESNLTYKTPITDDVEGWLTAERVAELVGEVARLPPHGGGYAEGESPDEQRAAWQEISDKLRSMTGEKQNDGR